MCIFNYSRVILTNWRILENRWVLGDLYNSPMKKPGKRLLYFTDRKDGSQRGWFPALCFILLHELYTMFDLAVFLSFWLSSAPSKKYVVHGRGPSGYSCRLYGYWFQEQFLRHFPQYFQRTPGIPCPLFIRSITWGPYSDIINIHSRRPPRTEEFITRTTAHEDIIYKISVQYSFLSNYPVPLGHIMQLNISHNKSRIMGFFNAYVVKFYFNHLWHSFILFYYCMSE